MPIDFWEPQDRDYIFYESLSNGDILQVRNLIASGVDINHFFDGGETTPLEIAVETGCIETVQILLEAGANPNTGFPGSALELASSHGYTEIAKMLIQYGARVTTPYCSALTMAVTAGHLDIVKILVEAGANINPCVEDQPIPLMWAASKGHYSIYEYLAPLTEPLLKTEAQVIALCWAASDGNLEALKLLYRVGANLNSKDWFGKTALMTAAEQGQIIFAEVLLQVGVDINARDNSGKTALILAVKAQKTKTTKALLHAGADLEVQDLDGKSALNYAVKLNDKVMIKILQDVVIS